MKKVLIVDDEPDVLMLLRVIFQGEGFVVCQAEDGQDALEKLAESPVDLVVTDLMMPRMDGYELIRRLRSEQATAQLPVVVVSARHGQVEGADAVLAKPFSSEELIGTCRALIGA